ncbi:hypothetical protein E4U43_002602, partial [Claviceps pusilla]
DGSVVDVLAVDINMIQPERLPCGVSTLPLDLEQPSWGPAVWENCDLVHIRQLFGSIRPDCWHSVYCNAFQHLRPGYGFIEHVEIDFTARWDVTPPDNSPIQTWSELYRSGMAHLGRCVEVDGSRVRDTLAGAGFVRLREESTRCLLGPTTTRREKVCEKWFNAALRANILGWSLVPMIEGLGFTKEQVEHLCNNVLRDLLNCRTPVYFLL